MFESNVHAREKPRRSLWIAHWSLFVIYFGGADNLYNIHWTHEMRCVYTLVDAIGSQLLVLVPIPTFGDPNNYSQLQHLHQHQYHRIWCLVRFIMSVVCSIFDYIMMMMCWFAFHRGSDSYPRQSFPTVGVNWCCWLKYCRFSVMGSGNDMMQKSGFFDPMIPHLTLPLILYDGEIWTRLTTLFTDGFTHSTEGVISIGKDECHWIERVVAVWFLSSHVCYQMLFIILSSLCHQMIVEFGKYGLEWYDSRCGCTAKLKEFDHSFSTEGWCWFGLVIDRWSTVYEKKNYHSAADWSLPPTPPPCTAPLDYHRTQCELISISPSDLVENKRRQR